MQKSADHLQHELDVIKQLEHEREISNEIYAKKIVETIVFTIVGLITIGFFTAVVKFFIISPK